MFLTPVLCPCLSSLANPYFLLAVLPPGGLYYLAQNYYVPTSRELKRLDSVSRYQ